MDGMRWGRGLLSYWFYRFKDTARTRPVNSKHKGLDLARWPSAVLATEKEPIRGMLNRRFFFSGTHKIR